MTRSSLRRLGALALLGGCSPGTTSAPTVSGTSTPADAGADAGLPGCAPARPRTGLTCTRIAAPLSAPRDVVEGKDGAIFVSEMAAGRIVRLDGDRFVPVASGLSAPIGIRILDDGALLVAEEPTHSVSRIDRTSGARSELARLDRNVTYLAVGPDGAAYVSSFATLEAPDGVVYRIDLATGAAAPFASVLTVPEGLAFDPRGRLHTVEWGTHPSQLTRLPERTVVSSGFVALYGLVRARRDDGWFVADVKRGRVVLVRDDGAQEEILTDAAAPAGMWVTARGDLLVVEHGDADTHAAIGSLLRISGL